jgi:hypothetical protein
MEVSLADVAEALQMINGTPSTQEGDDIICQISFGTFIAEVVISVSPGEEDDEPQILEIDFWLTDSEYKFTSFGEVISPELLLICNLIQEKTRWGKIQLREDGESGVHVALWCVIDITSDDISKAAMGSTESLFLRTLVRLSSEFSEIGTILLAYQRGDVKNKDDLDLLVTACEGEA